MNRGPWGRGSLYLRGKTWWIKYHANGRPCRESTATRDRHKAQHLLDIRLGQLATGDVLRPESRGQTVRDLLGLVEQDHQVNGHKALDRLQYSARHLTRFFGTKRAVGIGPPDVQRYVLSRQQAGAANATINRELAALRRGFNLGSQAGLLPRVPPVRGLRERNVRTGFFEEAEFLAVRQHLSPAVQAVVTVAYITGWRIRSEVLRLQWRQVDFAAGTVRLEPGSTKNDEGRVFPLIPALRALLEAERARTRVLERVRGRIIPWVFHRDGKPVRYFRTAWRTACRTSGLPGRIPHDFRRTAVRNLVRAGIPERVAMKLTGHKTRSVFDRYHIVNERDLQEAGVKLGSTLSPMKLGTIGAQSESASAQGDRKSLIFGGLDGT